LNCLTAAMPQAEARVMTRRTPALVLALGLLAVGCGGGGSDQPVPAPVDDPSATSVDDPGSAGDDSPATEADSDVAFGVDPCTLLTTDQVAAATGATAQDGELAVDQSDENQAVCIWNTDAGTVAFVQVFLNESSSAGQRATAEEALGVPAEDVEIPGATEAYAFGGLVGAQVGEYFVQVTVIPDDPEAGVTLAGQAVATLG
jgi:hypothetical protein